MTRASAATGALVLVATPIGNLGDLSPRAVETLRDADLVCCEDTRRTRVLLSAAGIPAGDRLRSLHAHNETSRIPELLTAAAEGRTVAMVTDAGTPAVSDPGARLVAAFADAGVAVTVVPGPSAAVAALVVSGLPTDRFCVEGFLPRSGAPRRRRLDAVVADPRTSVVFESPQRLAATLADLASLAPGRELAVCRELTKLHEEVWRGTASDAAAHFADRRVRGEVAVVVAGSGAPGGAPPVSGPHAAGDRRAGSGSCASDADVERVAAAALASGMSVRDAAAATAAELGVSRRRAYGVAVAIRHRAREARGGGTRDAPAPRAWKSPQNGGTR